jgi:hypothetical protein
MANLPDLGDSDARLFGREPRTGSERSPFAKDANAIVTCLKGECVLCYPRLKGFSGHFSSFGSRFRQLLVCRL